jgi:hypothetical protein
MLDSTQRIHAKEASTMTQRWHMGLGLALLLSLGMQAGCTDDPAADNNNMTDPGRMEPPKGEPPAGSKLVHVPPSCVETEVTCAGAMSINSGYQLNAKLISSDGKPIENTIIRFEIVSSDADGANLSAANGTTDAQGIARSMLRSGSDAGSVKVRASTNDAAVRPIEFIVGVSPKGASSYNVKFTKVGNTDPKNIEVFFFKDLTTCQQFLADVRKEFDNDPLTSPSLSAEFAQTGQAGADGTLPIVQLADVANGTAYTVGARAYARSNDDVEVAVGCKDNNPPVTNGMPVEVIVPLLKNLPNLVGTYRVVHTFDLRDGLPQNVRTVVDLLGVLVSSPGDFIIGCGCQTGGSNCMATSMCPIPTAGLLSIIFNILPDDGVLGDLKEAIESFLSSGFGQQVARDTINGLFENLKSRLPSWAQTGLQVTTDIYETLKRFEVIGTIKITQQPTYALDMNGLPMVSPDGELLAIWDQPTNEQVWENVVFFWRQGCNANSPPDCGRRTLANASIASNGMFIKGNFSGFVVNGSKLHINEHSLTLNYGALILAVVEQIVLPAAFGNPNINSIEALLNQFIDCNALAEGVAGSNSGAIFNATKNLCGQLKTQASDGLRKYVSERLVLDGANSFLIGTPDGEGCELLQPTVYPPVENGGKILPYVEKMGQEAPDTARCKWNVRIRFSENNQASISGKFHGTKNQ